jgi:hypothetical protein
MRHMRFIKLTAVLAVVGGVAASNVRADLEVQVAGGAVWSAGDPHPCASAVAARLQQHGLNIGDMRDVRWYADRFAREGGMSGPVDTYRFYGRPASCAKGSVAVTMGASCGVQSVRTQGGCEVAGIAC